MIKVQKASRLQRTARAYGASESGENEEDAYYVPLSKTFDKFYTVFYFVAARTPLPFQVESENSQLLV